MFNLFCIKYTEEQQHNTLQRNKHETKLNRKCLTGRYGTGSELLTRDPTRPEVFDPVTRPDPLAGACLGVAVGDHGPLPKRRHVPQCLPKMYVNLKTCTIFCIVCD